MCLLEDDMHAMASNNAQNTKSFNVGAGVKQDSVVPSTLFSVYSTAMLGVTKRRTPDGFPVSLPNRKKYSTLTDYDQEPIVTVVNRTVMTVLAEVNCRHSERKFETTASGSSKYTLPNV